MLQSDWEKAPPTLVLALRTQGEVPYLNLGWSRELHDRQAKTSSLQRFRFDESTATDAFCYLGTTRNMEIAQCGTVPSEGIVIFRKIIFSTLYIHWNAPVSLQADRK